MGENPRERGENGKNSWGWVGVGRRPIYSIYIGRIFRLDVARESVGRHVVF